MRSSDEENRQGFLPHLHRLVLVTGLFAMGLVAGHVTLHFCYRTPPDDMVADDSEDRDSSAPALATAIDEELHEYTRRAAQQNRMLGDNLLRNGEPFQALTHLLMARELKGTGIDAFLEYQIALCYEAADDLQNAKSGYQSIIRNHLTVSPNLVSGAELGLARIAHREGKTAAALEILWKKLFSPRSAYDRAFQVNLLYRTSQYSSEWTVQDTSDLLDQDSLSRFPDEFYPDVEYTNMLTVLDQSSSESAQESAGQKLVVDHVMVAEESPDAIILTIDAREATLMQILYVLEEKANLDFELSDQAASRAQITFETLGVGNISLATLLDRLCIANELRWHFLDGKVNIETGTLEDHRTSVGFVRSAASRLISRLLFEYPDHPSVQHTLFNQTLLQTHEGDFESAISSLINIIETTSDSQARNTCFFNLSRIYQAMGNMELAVDALRRVVDSESLGSKLIAAYLDMGTIYLERGDFPHAIDAFSNGLRMCKIVDSSFPAQLAAINLATSYLLSDQPHSAKRVMVANAHFFFNDDLGRVAKYLSALANFQLVNGNRVDPAQEDSMAWDTTSHLLPALANVEAVPQLGPYQHLVISRGWALLGAPDEVARFTSAGMELARTPYLRNELAFEMANNLIRMQDFEGARVILSTMVYKDDDLDSLRRLLLLAEIELDLGYNDRCKIICERLLEVKLPEEILAGTLKVMGHLHQDQGNHRIAALYFAGFLPE